MGIFSIQLEMKRYGSLDDGNMHLRTWHVSFPSGGPAAGLGQEGMEESRSMVSLQPDLFSKLHPFHLTIDHNLRIVQVGSGLRKACPRLSALGLHVDQSIQVGIVQLWMDPLL